MIGVGGRIWRASSTADLLMLRPIPAAGKHAETRLRSHPAAAPLHVATTAVACCAVCALLLSVAIADGTTSTDWIGFLSIPVTFVGTVLAVVAVARRSSRGRLSILAIGISLAYWAILAALILPKILASGRNSVWM